MREQTFLIAGVLGSFFVGAGVLLIIFRVRFADFHSETYQGWRNLIMSERQTSPRGVLVMGCMFAVMGAIFAVVGFVNL